MFLDMYFDSAKKTLDLQRDAVLARRLGITPQEIVRAKKTGHIRDEILLELSVITGASMEELVLAREADKAKRDEMRQVWARAYEQVKRASAAAMIGAVFLGISSPNAGYGTVVPATDAGVFITGIKRHLRFFFLSFLGLRPSVGSSLA